MTTRAFLIATLLTVGVSMGPRPAAADVEGTVYWSTAAHACTPSPPTIQNDRHTYLFNYASWNGTNLDTIVFYCSVQPNTGETSPNRMYLTTLDNTGSAADTYVHAELYKISRSTGGYTLLDTASSDSTSGTGVKEVFTTLGEAMDFDANFYYVRVEMDRDGTGDDARFYGVSLEYTP